MSARVDAGVDTPVVDVAGGQTGGAARWRAELDLFLSDAALPPIRVIGRGRHLTPRWLLERERVAGRGVGPVIASNNVSFGCVPRRRVVLVRQALHYLYPHEEHLLDRMPKGWGRQISIARALLRRADVIVAPCTAMADRVRHHYPKAGRIVIRPHPVTPVGVRKDPDRPFILVPVVPGPYKNLFEQVAELSDVLVALGHPAQIRLTADRHELPIRLAFDPRVVPIGMLPPDSMSDLWRTASGVFYPGTVEAFGYPLAEARAYGVPVISPNSPQAREIAGPALRGYKLSNPRSLAAAVERLEDELVPDPAPFDRDRYFFDLLSGRL